jgi:ArsR family transcriptional regulator, arsenate/arsenite/antimonite-responsive transcriptional repressor
MRKRQPGLSVLPAVLTAMADPLRLRILRLVLRRELCVCEVMDALQIPQYRVSRHLMALRRLGLVAARREGRWMHYRAGPALTDPGVIRDLVEALGRYLGDLAEARGDEVRLRRRLAMRQAGRCVIGTQTVVLSIGSRSRPASTP